MPNWCENRLVVCGSEHALESFMSAARTEEEPFSMQAFVPMPEELRELKSGGREIDGKRVSQWREVTQPDGTVVAVAITPAELADYQQRFGATGWYEWAHENWGCKWDMNVSDITEDYSHGEVVIDFETPWGPPRAFMATLAGMFPALRFVHLYAEPGMGFGGEDSYEKGQSVGAMETGTVEDTRCLSEWHADRIGPMDDDEELETDTDEGEDE